MPWGLAKADHQHAFVLRVEYPGQMKGFEVSTVGTRWKLTCVLENCGQM
jgi:hypothetical protein